jgi:hypothetical protein
MYEAWIKGTEAHFKFSELAAIKGPFKFYVNADAIPGAGCPGCPSGPTARYVVPPEAVYQKWKPQAKTVEAYFPIALIGDLVTFFFTCTTVAIEQEWYLASGESPHQ